MNPVPAGSLPPLFQRLCGTFPAAEDRQLLDIAGLQRSLQQDLIRLFNVRAGLTIDQFLGDSPTVLNYGLPDLLALSPYSAIDVKRLELMVMRAIALYEPRLSQVQVKVAPDGSNSMAARVNIGAFVVMGQQLCQVDFELVLDKPAAQQNATEIPA